MEQTTQKKSPDDGASGDLRHLEIAGPTYNLMADMPVPYPGVPGAAIPRRFSALVRDAEKGCVLELEVVVDNGAPRLRRFAVVADEPLTPTAIRRLPIGTYLDAVVSCAVLKSERMSDHLGAPFVRLTPMSDFDAAADIVRTGRVRRRRRTPLTEERLKEVADAYNRAPLPDDEEQSAVWRVAEQQGCEKDYARQLIYRARKANLLPPANPGKED